MGEKNLVIVESPAKAKTIEKFLGKDFTVKSSFGHICDLSKKKLGIDVENGFEPKYEISADKKKIVSELKSLASKADTVWLASDEDREGEAIAWHLQNSLKLSAQKSKRIVFHEITKNAILNAIENPRKVDTDLVMAQQARRVLDRLVGFELSPILWHKVAPKLSAGRVQSVAVRLIVDKEHEIQAFKPTSFYKVTAEFYSLNGDKKQKLNAQLSTKVATKEQAMELLERCKGSKRFWIENIEKKESRRSPAPPFTTSALQQEASRKLGFSVSQTMRVAQQLYENGLITYMRTDSTNLSTLAIGTIKQAIEVNYGAEYSKTRKYTTKSKGAQEAHEAIRPTYAANTTIDGTAQEKKLYDLIWKRAVASQMADAKLEKTIITIAADNLSEKFICEGEQVLFDGFLRLYLEGHDDEPEDEMTNQLIPSVAENEDLAFNEISAIERFTQRPSRYTEASLVKKMEELGIGRPSTYAPTITTIIQRGYVIKDSREGSKRDYQKLSLSSKDSEIKIENLSEIFGAEKNKLFPQDIGILVTEYLEKNFEDILNYGFTANIEEGFDKVAAGKLQWNTLIKEFYTPFHRRVEEADQEKGHINSERLLGTDPKSGEPIIVRLGKFGPVAQKGESANPNKTFASLHKNQSIETITLEEALKLFDLPRIVGEYNGETLTAAIGRFGPYIKYGSKFVSIGKELDPYTITEAQAIGLIQEKESMLSNMLIKEFKEEGIQILNGRYGPYIKFDGKNYKIPKGKNAPAAENLTLQECKNYIEKGSTTPKRGRAKSK